MTALGTTAAGAPIDVDLDELIGSHLLAIANSGGGKSGLLRRLLETTSGRIQQFVLDPEDELYTLRERFDFVIAGGDSADVPATIAGAGALALHALEHGYSLIVQMNDLVDDAAPEFVANFLRGLMSAPQALWRPVLVAIDELQRFAPSGPATEASKPVKDLVQRGRKRGFTLLGASTAMTEIDPRVRGLVNNWMLGRVGQALDRNTMAQQLGFTAKEGRELLRSIEKRQFWGLGPAIAADPVLFRVAEVETTPVQRGQAKPPTPPAPEALREILQGLAAAAPAALPDDTIPADPVAAWDKGTAVGSMIVERDQRIAELEARVRELEAENSELDAECDRWVAGVGAIDELVRQVQQGTSPAQLAVPAHMHSSDANMLSHDANSQSAPPPVAKGAAPAGNGAGEKAGAAPKRPKATGPHPLASTIVAELEGIAPAQLTWRQLASILGYSPDGGYFRAGKRQALDSGSIVENGDYVRSSAESGQAHSRTSAIALWKRVLPEPAPRMIEELATLPFMTKAALATALGYAETGGYFRKGLALLRQNGVTIESGDTVRLAPKLPGEASA